MIPIFTSISIHPSRVGWDSMENWGCQCIEIFQSTHPVWDGTLWIPSKNISQYISIHPSRVGWDAAAAQARSNPTHFNPPIPCGMGRRLSGFKHRDHDFNPPIPCGMGRRAARANFGRDLFQSTHPVWDGTRAKIMADNLKLISIHPSRVGWDRARYCRHKQENHFNPPIPCGMGLVIQPLDLLLFVISIHPSRVGWDSSAVRHNSWTPKFQSTHPVWDGTRYRICPNRHVIISIHPSRVGWDDSVANASTDDRQISIHPSRVGWDAARDLLYTPSVISIHPSRVGWDC